MRAINKKLSNYLSAILTGSVSMNLYAEQEVVFKGVAMDRNNQKYVFEKYIEDGDEKSRYTDYLGKTYEQLPKDSVKANKMSPEVKALMNLKSGQNRMISFSVLLKSADIDSSAITKSFESQKEQLRTEFIEKKSILGQKRIDEIHSEIDILLTAYRQEMGEQKKAAFASVKQKFIKTIESLGGSIRFVDFSSGIAEVTLKVKDLEVLKQLPYIYKVEKARAAQTDMNTVVVTQGLRDASPSNNISGPWFDGYFGAPYDLGIIDGVTNLDSTNSCATGVTGYGGVQQNHPRLDHINYINVPPNTQSTDIGGHPTKVAGVMLSNDATYTGLSYAPDLVYVGDCICNEETDLTWMMTNNTDTPEVINISCGASRYDSNNNNAILNPTDDIAAGGVARDNNIDLYQMILVQSAGNDGGISTVNSIGMDTGYNPISVAAADDKNTTFISDETLSDFSSRGPSLVLGRKKPDITAVGTKVKTTRHNWADPNTNDFVNANGTSFSAPTVSGAAMLLVNSMADPDPLAIKSLLINNAIAWSDNGTPGNLDDDFQLSVTTSEWNSSWGWGYLDLAYTYFRDWNYTVQRLGEPGNGTYPTIRYYLSSRSQNFNGKATLVWNKHNNIDLTDLDLFVYDADTGNESARSYSGVDNVEQVGFGPENFVVKVKPWQQNLPSGLLSEKFALAGVRDSDERQPPSFDFGFNSSAINPGQTFTWSLSAQNTGGLPVNNVQLSIDVPEGYQVLSANPVNVGSIQPGEYSNTAFFTVQAPCSDATGPLTMNLSVNNYGEVFTNQYSYNITNNSNVNPLYYIPRNEGQVPALYSVPITQGVWSMATTITGVQNQWISLEMILDRCTNQIVDYSDIASTTEHNWTAINGQKTTSETAAFVQIEATNGTPDAYRDQWRIDAARLSPGESQFFNAGLFGDIMLYQIDNFYRGMQLVASASGPVNNMQIDRLNGARLSGSSNNSEHDQTAFNTMTLTGTGDSPALVVSPYGQRLFSGDYGLSLSDVHDCSAAPLDDIIFRSGMEGDETGMTDYTRESSYIHFPDQSSSQNAVIIPYSTDFDTQSITVEAWVKPSAGFENDGLNFILGKNYSGTGFALLASGTNGSKNFEFQGNGQNGNPIPRSSTVPVAGQWYHVAGTYTNDTARIYVNGVMEDEVSVTGNLINNNQHISIGSSIFGDALDWQGDMDEVRIWNRALTADEIKNNAQACLTGNESGLLGYWRFDATSAGTVALDASTNYNNGGLVSVVRIQ